MWDNSPRTAKSRGRGRRGRLPQTLVVFYSVVGAGHTWPGGWPIPGGLGKTNKDIDATEETWRFFQGYSLEREP